MFRHGLRSAELVALKWSNVDLKGGYLAVHRVKHGHDSVHPLRASELRALRQLQLDYPETQYVKQDPGKPILKNLKALVLRLKWLLELHNYQTALLGIPSLKVKHFASEAISLGAARMKRLEPYKRYALAVSLIATSYARTLDDLAEMFIKRMKKIHLKAKEALELYRQEHQDRTDRLVTTFRDVLLAYSTEGEAKDKLTQIETVIGNNAEEMLSECEAHIAYAGNNYYPFLWRYYRSHARHLVSDSQTGRAEIFNSR